MDKFNSIADAIEAGAAMTHQAFGRLQDGEGGTCVIGAAMVAVGIRPTQDNIHKLVERFPQPLGSQCPICDLIIRPNSRYEHLSVAMHLNDSHNRSRKWIANWIRCEQIKRDSIPTATSSLIQCSSTEMAS